MEEGDREGQVQDDVVLEPHLWGLDLILKATEKPLKFLVCLFYGSAWISYVLERSLWQLCENGCGYVEELQDETIKTS